MSLPFNTPEFKVRYGGTLIVSVTCYFSARIWARILHGILLAPFGRRSMIASLFQRSMTIPTIKRPPLLRAKTRASSSYSTPSVQQVHYAAILCGNFCELSASRSEVLRYPGTKISDNHSSCMGSRLLLRNNIKEKQSFEAVKERYHSAKRYGTGYLSSSLRSAKVLSLAVGRPASKIEDQDMVLKA